ncbi:MAG TPA: ATP-dependent DNA helicase [Verrucomicrobiota bacterium]|nr:ATP-dependent DNA helicase [Verrucomicrobiota bacterium]
MPSPAKPVHTVQVRALVEFVLRGGDLGGERDFVGPRRALAGTRGHQRLQRSRAGGYQKEVALHHDVEDGGCVLRVQGRLDGLWIEEGGTRIEEIKTIQGAWERRAHPLHWAQAKCYGFMYAEAQGLESIDIQLTYLDVDTDEVTEYRERFCRAELGAFFFELTAVYFEWLRARLQWCRERDASMGALEFPFPRYRPGQRAIAVAGYRAMSRGGRLFVEAPTGIGKTVATLFSAVKAMGQGKVERLFYLTARTVGRVVAEQACSELRRAGLRLRAVTLTAREKICTHAGGACDPENCPMARGYYDRHRAAMRALLAHEAMTRCVIEEASRAHRVCPFELSLDVSSWVDAVICDYNYVFDPQAYLRRHFLDEPGRYAFLVDEAHNLVDRAREMFSADLNTREIREVRRAIQERVPRCAKALNRLAAAMRKLGGPTAQDDNSVEPGSLNLQADLFSPIDAVSRERSGPDSGSKRADGADARDGARTSREFPRTLEPLIEEALAQTEEWLVGNEPAEFRESLIELYFRLHAFRRTAGLYDAHYATIIEPGASVRVRLFCLNPSCLLQQALARGRSALFFSATLTPVDYYRSLLGGSLEDPVLRLPSPFPPGNLAVLAHDRIRTVFKARTQTLDEVVQAVGALVRGRVGNYIVYLPSYQYLGAVQERFHTRFPDATILAQHPGMGESEREAFLEAFAADGETTRVGFAVLGGVFGEGIDLAGERLIGVAVVGVGLPQLCIERDLIRDYFEERTCAGFDYAYTFPGMNRVLQAVGRVIRSETDRGVILLVDTRFAESRYRALFPAGWNPVTVRSLSAIQKAVGAFWESAAGWT